MSSEWLLSSLLLAAYALIPHVAAQTPPPQKIDIVTVTGCLTQGPGDTWSLTNATDPVVESRAPAKLGPPAGTATTTKPPTVGKNRFELIGLMELNVPSHKGHTVTIKGLLIPAKPDRKINLTSVQMVSDTCSPASGSAPPKPPRV